MARSYGQRVAAAEVHNNPLTKVYLCQTIGYDSRLKGSCAGTVRTPTAAVVNCGSDARRAERLPHALPREVLRRELAQGGWRPFAADESL